MNQEQNLPSKSNILVVDDTPANLNLLTQILSEQRYEVRVAPSGKLALRAIESTLPDLILLDINMPEMDGYQVCEQLKAAAPTREIPVIFVSALDEVLDKVKAFSVGGVDYITKPFEPAEVLARIENQLRLRSLQLELMEQNALLQKQIEGRRRAEVEVRLLLATTQALNRSHDIHSGLAAVLRLVCMTIQWNYGEAWIPNEDSTVLECSPGWYASETSLSKFRHQSSNITFAPNVGLPGRIWSSKQPEWIEDISVEQSQVFLRFQIAADAGLKAAFGVPILDKNQVLAILVFYKKTPDGINSRLIELVTAVATQLGWQIQRKLAGEALEFQKEQTEKLLLNILPKPIAQRLQKGQRVIADSFSDVSVLFADLVGFTDFCSKTTPTELVEILNRIFSKFDHLSEQHGLEKIKTIGDNYMVVGGLPTYRSDHIEAIAHMALDMQAVLASFNVTTGKNFLLRIGINIGPVVAGVIGLTKFIYDLWGDTVNVASRMESSGISGEIQVTTAVYERLKEQFVFKKRGSIPIKGKGEMTTYLLLGSVQK
jgi:class 3 adenylate cyclase/DNA-binding response OmpR family regulator